MEVYDFNFLDKKISCDCCFFFFVYEKFISCILVLDEIIVNYIYSIKVVIMGNIYIGLFSNNMKFKEIIIVMVMVRIKL